MKNTFVKTISNIAVAIAFMSFAGCAIAQTAKPVPQNENYLIKMDKGGCFGTCPVYTIYLYPNGKVIFDGRIYVKQIGVAKTKISKKRIKAIKNDFNNAKFFEFKDEYTANQPDFPTTTIIYKTDGKTKKIIDYLDAPPLLKALEQEMIDIANTKNWITDPSENK